MIAHRVEGDIVSLVSSQRLVWLPAHQTTGAIMNRWLSNGKRFSVVDWRANRLADAVAKMMANDAAPANSSMKTVKSGIAACRHAAAVLGLLVADDDVAPGSPLGTSSTAALALRLGRKLRLPLFDPARCIGF